MKIIKSVFEKSSSKISECPKGNLPEFALVGRSNVGKSSLINTLLNKKSIAKTSSKPGKTLLINHFKINDKFYLVDLPGYGYANTSKQIIKEIKKRISFLIDVGKYFNNDSPGFNILSSNQKKQFGIQK